MAQRKMIMVTERRAVSAGAASGAEREIIERVGLPVSRIRATRPVIITNWAGPRGEQGDYPLAELTQISLGSPEEYILVTETGAQLADLINGELDPADLRVMCRAVRHPGESPRPTHRCVAERGHEGFHVWELL